MVNSFRRILTSAFVSSLKEGQQTSGPRSTLMSVQGPRKGEVYGYLRKHKQTNPVKFDPKTVKDGFYRVASDKHGLSTLRRCDFILVPTTTVQTLSPAYSNGT